MFASAAETNVNSAGIVGQGGFLAENQVFIDAVRTGCPPYTRLEDAVTSITRTDTLDAKASRQQANAMARQMTAWNKKGKDRMRIINITPLLTEHKKEIVADLLNLKRDCGVTDVAFMLPLHAQMKPLMAKPDYLCARFAEMNQALRGSGLKTGILVQTSIGLQTRIPDSDADFQRIVTSDGTVSTRMCPLDRGFQQYMRDVITTCCRAKPDFLFMDDNYRLCNMGQIACFCPLHMEAFNKRAGAAYDREKLIGALQKEDPESRQIGALWAEVSLASMLELSHAIREAIDAVNPDITCGFCAFIGDVATARPIALALAGKTRPFVRVHNAWYLENIWYSALGYKFVPKRMYHSAVQMPAFSGIPEVVAEADTYCHTRYSLSARSLNGQIVASLLDGVTGLKLWITVMHQYEPESGRAYRAVMKSNQGLYRELFRIVPSVTWRGPVTPAPREPVSNWNPIISRKQCMTDDWGGDVCGRLGIPARYGEIKSDVVMLCDRQVDFFSDDELAQFCKKSLCLDGLAAEKMCQRGLGRYLGVSVTQADWDLSGWSDGERYAPHPVNDSMGRGKGMVSPSSKRLIIEDKRVQVVSTLFKAPWYMSPDERPLGPGLVLFENDDGGRVAVYAGHLSLFVDGESRKKQFMLILDWLNRAPLPFVVLGDVDLYVRHGVIASGQGGGDLLAVFNLNQDALPDLRLRVADPNIAEVRLLGKSGEWAKSAWRRQGDSEIIVDIPVETMQPLILIIRR